MRCKKCGAQYSSRELKCPYCGEPNSLGIRWKKSEENAKNETEKVRKLVIYKAPLYVINQIWNVVICVSIVLLVLFFIFAFVSFQIEEAHRKQVQSTASVEEAEAYFEAEDDEGLEAYMDQHDAYYCEGYDKYLERHRLFFMQRNILEAMMDLQNNEDWGKGEAPAYYQISIALDYAHDPLERYSWEYEEQLQYPENQRYQEQLLQNAVALLMGTLGMTEDEIVDMMSEKSFYDETQNRYIRTICERKGWEYSEN